VVKISISALRINYNHNHVTLITFFTLKPVSDCRKKRDVGGVGYSPQHYRVLDPREGMSRATFLEEVELDLMARSCQAKGIQ